MADALYSVEALSTGGGRDGHVATADKAVDLEMAPPKELGGSGEGNNPEQLFAAGYAACFHSALQSAARSKKVTIDGSSVGARVSLVRSGEESIDLAVDLEVTLPGIESDVADELAKLAHEMCPYSRATQGNIEVSVSVSEESHHSTRLTPRTPPPSPGIRRGRRLRSRGRQAGRRPGVTRGSREVHAGERP